MSHLFMQSAGRFEGIALDLGLAPTDLGALLHLDPEGTPSQGQLAQHWSCDASWVTAKVDSLEASGLVTRRSDSSDRRRKTVTLTAAGQRTQAEALDRLYDPPDQLAGLSLTDLRAVARVLAKLDVPDPRAPGPRRFPGPKGPGATPAKMAGAVGRAAKAAQAGRAHQGEPSAD